MWLTFNFYSEDFCQILRRCWCIWPNFQLLIGYWILRKAEIFVLPLRSSQLLPSCTFPWSPRGTRRSHPATFGRNFRGLTKQNVNSCAITRSLGRVETQKNLHSFGVGPQTNWHGRVKRQRVLGPRKTRMLERNELRKVVNRVAGMGESWLPCRQTWSVV